MGVDGVGVIHEPADFAHNPAIEREIGGHEVAEVGRVDALQVGRDGTRGVAALDPLAELGLDRRDARRGPEQLVAPGRIGDVIGWTRGQLDEGIVEMTAALLAWLAYVVFSNVF